MSNLFNTDIAGQIESALTGQIKQATVKRTTTGTYDPVNDSQSTTTASYDTEGFVEDYNERLKVEGVVQDNDRRIILLANPLDIVPSVGDNDNKPDEVEIEGDSYTIMHVERDPAGAIYTIQGRL